MTIHLRAPEYKPGGPDGQGWNRLSLNAHMGGNRNQCALRPRSYASLWESQDTRRAEWGSFGRCAKDGNCSTCPVAQARPRLLAAFTDRVLVRELDRTPAAGWTTERRVELHAMNRPEDGWSSSSRRWTWEELARLPGWRLGRQFRDEHSEGFWLVKVNPGRFDGLPECAHGYLNRDHCPTCRAEVSA